MFKKIFVIFFLSTFAFLLLPRVYGVDNGLSVKSEFATTYDVVYDIDSTGVTTVTEKINLKNLTSQSFANQFKLIIGATSVYDIKASDAGGAMPVTSETKGTSTTISVKFNQQIVGINKILPWTLQFKSKDFAEELGKVWEVRAPKVSSTTNLESYNLTIAVPSQFGEPTIISPTPRSETTSSDKLFITFDKDSLLQSGVSASFGSQQIFDFDLTYHLSNDNLFPILTNITLPPDTAYQDVIYQRIEPTPVNVTVDDDGNYLAWFRLNHAQRLDVKVVGSAKLYTKSKVKEPSLDSNLRKIYTQSDVYWEKNSPQITNKLTEILGSTPPIDSTEKAKLIYQYVVNSLKYDSSRLNGPSKVGAERLGAVTALNNPTSAVCMEFTDLFIALARAAGIPSRELDGFAYTANTTLRPLSLNKDILHAWPEFWDEKRGWVMVDPTWENTTGGVDYFDKLDLNHFVFVTKGSSSSQPIPAGSFKYLGQDSHDVKVQLSENDFLGTAHLDVKVENPGVFLAGFPAKIKVKISNAGNAVYPSNAFSISANKLSILEGDTQKLGPIPAFGTAEFNLNVRTKTLFDSFSDQIIVLVGSQRFTRDVTIKPFLIFQTYPVIAVAIISLIVIVYLTVLGGHIYRVKRKRKK